MAQPPSTSTTLTTAELEEIARANDSGRTPVVFVHGLWLLSSSWDRWRRLFEENGYSTVAPGWPDDPDTVAAAREHPELFARKMVQAVTDHYLAAIEKLGTEPAVVGHSFGGLIAQKIAGDGVAAVTVAIDPAPGRGVLPLPASALKSGSPVLGNPANARRSVTLTFEEFTYGWANTLDEVEARQLYEDFHVAASGVPIFQAAVANLNPFSETRVDFTAADRGPLLIVSGEKDHTVPHAISHAAYTKHAKNTAVTEFVEIPDRGHSLVIDHGWGEVAQTALDFIQTHGPSV
ncbi:alpha/beta hydrolase [Cellulosimicrobium arenosum]|uniref:Alpha/beta hydrolase n=1 Tax=Cellulosimicrobium arenosum TaxID=2708133 RepID=A0A927IYR1_9MICO|nr:alpha/beta hydrolase [Cellulosimicrobium arenosum]MBD8077633.1 alpha/beta hydrolase [Cellulosimicrobium arenosum]